MLTFVVIAILYLFFSWVITRHLNGREIRKALISCEKIDGLFSCPILMPVCGRPQYLRQVLEALSRVQNIDKTVLIISQDGNEKTVGRLIREIKFSNTVVLKHTRPFLGIVSLFWDNNYAVSTNIHFLLNFAFLKLDSTGAIILEDDLVPSIDFCNYFEWAFRHILLKDESALSVTGFNLNSRICPKGSYNPGDHPHDMVRNQENGRDKFTGWGWGITKIMWTRIKGHWSFLNWDIELDKTQRKLGLKSFKPVLGRVRNIGMRGINFTEMEEKTKWKDVHISQELIDYSRPPHFLETETEVPHFEDHRPSGIESEKALTRRNRLLLMALIVIMSILELYYLFHGIHDL